MIELLCVKVQSSVLMLSMHKRKAVRVLVFNTKCGLTRKSARRRVGVDDREEIQRYLIMQLPVRATERARAEALQKHLNEALKQKEEIKEQLNKTRYQLEIELRNAVTLRQKLVKIREKEEVSKQQQVRLGRLGTGTDDGKQQLREELAQARQELLREMELSRRQEEKTKSLQQTLALQMEKNGMLIQGAKRAEGMPVLEKRVRCLMLVVKKQSVLIDLLKQKCKRGGRTPSVLSAVKQNTSPVSNACFWRRRGHILFWQKHRPRNLSKHIYTGTLCNKI